VAALMISGKSIRSKKLLVEKKCWSCSDSILMQQQHITITAASLKKKEFGTEFLYDDKPFDFLCFVKAHTISEKWKLLSSKLLFPLNGMSEKTRSYLNVESLLPLPALTVAKGRE
jgi:hypothetical protein